MIRINNRFFFYAVVVITHIAWFYGTGNVPTAVEALILITMYFVFIAESIEINSPQTKPEGQIGRRQVNSVVVSDVQDKTADPNLKEGRE